MAIMISFSIDLCMIAKQKVKCSDLVIVPFSFTLFESVTLKVRYSYQSQSRHTMKRMQERAIGR